MTHEHQGFMFVVDHVNDRWCAKLEATNTSGDHIAVEITNSTEQAVIEAMRDIIESLE